MDREAKIRAYLTPPADAFWRWEDGGRAVAWSNGNTIAFDEELSGMLKHLAANGLPRFGSLLLLLAATRENWAAEGSETAQLSQMMTAAGGNGPVNTVDLLDKVIAGLQTVRELEPSLRRPLAAKTVLAELVFEGLSAEIPVQDAAEVADAIRPGLMGLLDDKSDVQTLGYGPLLLLQDLADLAVGLERLTPERLRLRIKTGLDELPVPASADCLPEELSPNESARALIEELLESVEHAGLARVAKQLIASTSLPRRLTHTQRHETGGFSDIANRGTPDRLLLSELAQDGLTLAVRVAMNEAMYLHREQPPETPRLRRELLIDSGVRSWGTPRVLAAAVALAFAASTPRGAPIGVWRGHGDSLQPVDITSKEGLIEHLAALEAQPNVAAALPEFTRRMADADEDVEAILLVPADALSDREFADAVRRLEIRRLYLATVSRSGEFQLIERLPRGEKLIRASQIDVDQLTKPGIRTLAGDRLDSLPAIFHLDQFPLLLPHPVDAKRCWYLEGWGALSITTDGRLMRWTERGRGAFQLSESIPGGTLWWIASNGLQGRTSFIVGTPGALQLITADLGCDTTESVHLQCTKAKSFTAHNGALFGINPNYVFTIDKSRGAVVEELAVPRYLTWNRGRYFNDADGGWHALSYDGLSARFEEVPIPARGWRNDLVNSIVGVWDVWGEEGPFALTSAGAVIRLSDRVVQVRCPAMVPLRGVRSGASDWQLHWHSPDGRCIAVSYLYMGRKYLFQINVLDVRVNRVGPAELDGRVAAIARPVAYRNRFRSIGSVGGEELVLRSQKGKLVSITMKERRPLLVPYGGGEQVLQEQEFRPVEPNERGYRLSAARWPDGSRALLDSRGLLHLVPAREQVPEVSIVLAEGELTGWCNAIEDRAEPHTGCFGKEYFRPAEIMAASDWSGSSVYRMSIAKFSEEIGANH